MGFAVEEVARYLVKGKITAIDKSPAMIEKAIRRNQRSIEQGKAKFIQSELVGFEKNDVRYDKVFCFNVNLFWVGDSIAREISVIKSLLRRKGFVYIFYGPMLGDGFEKIASPLRKNLAKENLKVIDFLHEKRLKCCCFTITVHP